MNALLVGLSAKYIHTPLAVHLLAEYARQQYGLSCRVAEYTINQSEELILSEISRLRPELVGFSVYIWNWALAQRLCKKLKRVLPGVKILLGGPEVSYDPAAAIEASGADFVLSGEGEEPFSILLKALEKGSPLTAVPGLSYREEGQIRINPVGPPTDLSKLPFVYGDLSRFENRILYYEAQRGCPFNCQYCLSSADKGVRFAPLDKVKAELKRFLDGRVRQVKFVDRTFNANPRFAMEIWKFLSENDNGVTNFHFEMEAGLITKEEIAFLATVRKGLFQFEIGVQTLNPRTLAAIDRRDDFEKLARVVRALKKPGNIHLHLDLIAGLPFEDYPSFKASYDGVYALAPDQLQLGFLKLLKGSGLRRDAGKYGIQADDAPPYEVLFTDALPFEDLCRLKEIEALNDLYYNSGRFKESLAFLTGLAGSPFSFFEGFSLFWREKGYHIQPPSKLGQYEALLDFGRTLPGFAEEAFLNRLKFDCCSHEKPGRYPKGLSSALAAAHREESLAVLGDEERVKELLPGLEGEDPKRLYKLCHIEWFSLDPLTGEETECAYLFDYRRTDLLGNAFFARL